MVTTFEMKYYLNLKSIITHFSSLSAPLRISYVIVSVSSYVFEKHTSEGSKDVLYVELTFVFGTKMAELIVY